MDICHLKNAELEAKHQKYKGRVVLRSDNISHFSSTVCSDKMAKRSQHDSGGRTSHSKIATNDESYRKGSVERIILDFSKPGEERLRKSRSMEFNDRGDLIKAQIYFKPPIIITLSNSWKASLQQVIQNEMTTVLGLLKSGKLRSRRTTDRGDLIKLLGEWCEKFDLVTRKFFSTSRARRRS